MHSTRAGRKLFRPCAIPRQTLDLKIEALSLRARIEAPERLEDAGGGCFGRKALQSRALRFAKQQPKQFRAKFRIRRVQDLGFRVSGIRV